MAKSIISACPICDEEVNFPDQDPRPRNFVCPDCGNTCYLSAHSDPDFRANTPGEVFFPATCPWPINFKARTWWWEILLVLLLMAIPMAIRHLFFQKPMQWREESIVNFITLVLPRIILQIGLAWCFIDRYLARFAWGIGRLASHAGLFFEPVIPLLGFQSLYNLGRIVKPLTIGNWTVASPKWSLAFLPALILSGLGLDFITESGNIILAVIFVILILAWLVLFFAALFRLFEQSIPDRARGYWLLCFLIPLIPFLVFHAAKTVEKHAAECSNDSLKN